MPRFTLRDDQLPQAAFLAITVLSCLGMIVFGIMVTAFGWPWALLAMAVGFVSANLGMWYERRRTRR